MTRTITTITLLVPLIMTLPALGEPPAPGKQVERQLQLSDGRTISYLLYLPPGYDRTTAPAPLVLFLHGRGESFGDLRLVEKWGPPRMAARGDDLHYILVSPQCPQDEEWKDDSQQAALVELLDHVEETLRVDAERVYLTGLSMGGAGSWRLAADHADRFAAMVLVCGSGNVGFAERLKNLPIWVFHGEEDGAVAISESRAMVDAIRQAGGTKVRFTPMPHIGHNSWSATYATPDVFEWMFEHTRR